MAFLAVDIGNSQTVLGLFDDGSLTDQWRLSSTTHNTIDDTWQALGAVLAPSLRNGRTITGVGISSVVPLLTQVYASVTERHLHTAPLIVSGSDPLLGITNHYVDPAAVGPDRICNVIAGYAKYGGPLIIVDLGTATTYEVVAANGDFLGGAITLGIHSTAVSLHQQTAMLPEIPLAFPQSVVARDTPTAIQAGILFGAADAVEGMIRRMRREIGDDTRVVATGGLATLLSPHCPSIETVEPSLVLEGIRLIWNKHQPR